jgi:Motility quorum-sensing regulator, toxin of MqsA
VITLGGEVTARHQVVLFLHLMKQTALQRFIFVDRSVNLVTLARLGITREEAQSLVMGLTPEHYVRGPDQDDNYPDLEGWVFGLQVTGSEVYVKIQVIVEPARCVCISFHESERPMHYPFRETEPPANEEEQR